VCFSPITDARQFIAQSVGGIGVALPGKFVCFTLNI